MGFALATHLQLTKQPLNGFSCINGHAGIHLHLTLLRMFFHFYHNKASVSNHLVLNINDGRAILILLLKVHVWSQFWIIIPSRSLHQKTTQTMNTSIHPRIITKCNRKEPRKNYKAKDHYKKLHDRLAWLTSSTNFFRSFKSESWDSSHLIVVEYLWITLDLSKFRWNLITSNSKRIARRREEK